MELVIVGHIYRDMIVRPDGKREALAGAPVYATTAASLGAVGVGIVSCVGTDFSDSDTTRLINMGVDTSALYRRGAVTTQVITVEEETNKRKMVVGTAPTIREIDLPDKHLSAGIIYFSPVINEIERGCLVKAAKTEAITALDIDGCLKSVRTDGELTYNMEHNIHQQLAYATFVSATPVSLALITGATTEQAASEDILNSGPYILVVRKEESGTTIYSQHGKKDFPYIMPSHIKDPNGPDYVFMIALLLEFMRTGGDLTRSGYFASACASLCAESRGPFEPVSRYQVERRMKSIY